MSGLAVIRAGIRGVDSLLTNRLMEWHDSELLAIDAAPATQGEILLDAYVDDTRVEGGNQRVRINVQAMRFEHPVPELPSLIDDGVLVLRGVEHNHLVLLPMRFEGEVRLTLTMRELIPELLFSGTGMTVESDGEFRFVEMVPFDPFN
jgi:hypothetical protein